MKISKYTVIEAQYTTQKEQNEHILEMKTLGYSCLESKILNLETLDNPKYVTIINNL